MNNKTDIDVQYVSPFKKICMTIGELPSSYLETMSYYEMLVWFTEFLKNQVIPTVNNNAEAVQELQSLYEELRTYVNDYFDNLDVQDEINNKLDEMAESGQLTDIIAQYLGLAGMIAYDTVADMKLAENLVNGSKCTTLGFHSANDGGSALYKVRTVTNADVIDEKTKIALYDNTLIAELIKTPEMSVKQFGAYGDNIHDDTNAINTAISYADSINIPNGTYLIEPAKRLDTPVDGEGIKIHSNKSLYLEENAILQCKTNDYFYYQVVTVDNASNVTIRGGHIYGDKLTHTGDVTSQFGCCVYVYSSSNVKIENCEVAYGFGDSITIGAINSGDDATNNCKNVTINNCVLHDSRRNGLSIISAENTKVLGCEIYNISGVDPQNAIDIEANYDTNPVKDVFISNCNLHDTTKASITITMKSENVIVSDCQLEYLNNVTLTKNVRINNCVFNTKNNDLSVFNNTANDIILSNCTFTKPISLGGDNGSIKIFNSIIKDRIIAPDNASFTAHIDVEDSQFYFTGTSSLFVLRENTYLKLNNCYIESNKLLNSLLAKELILTNSTINNLTAGVNGFQAYKVICKNNIIRGSKYYNFLTLGDTSGDSYITENTFETNPDRCFAGTGPFTQKVYVVNNTSKSALTIKPPALEVTNLVTANNNA